MKLVATPPPKAHSSQGSSRAASKASKGQGADVASRAHASKRVAPSSQRHDVHSEQAAKKLLGGDKIAASDVVAPPIPSRRLPGVREAIADASITALSPTSIQVPAHVLDVLRSAKRILVVGHVPPDGDCVGSAVGLARALKALGKDAVPVVDDDLPAQSRAIDAHGEVKRFADAGGEFDLVVLVDVAGTTRIGGVELAAFDNVLVVDHHEDEPTHTSLGLAKDARLTTFIDPHADAAAVLIAGIAAHIAPGDAAPFIAAQEPLASAMYTDTLGFKAPGAALDTLRLFKGVVGDVASLDVLEARLSPPLPTAAAAILDAVDPVVIKGKRGKGGSALFAIDHATFSAALAAARAVDSQTTAQDIRSHLMQRADARRDLHGFAALVMDEGDLVRVSLRSIDDATARLVAESLGGGGHGRSAATILHGASLTAAVTSVERAFADVRMQLEAQLRIGRS